MFYEVLAPGYHSPLTKTEIAELFQAGRLDRHTPCKPEKGTEWQTIDELFPLLKYHVPYQFADQSSEATSEYRSRRGVVAGVGVAGAVAATLLVYLYCQCHSPTGRSITTIDSKAASTSQPPTRASVVSAQPNRNTVSPSTTVSFSNVRSNDVVVRAENPNPQSYVRSAEAARIAEENRRAQAQAEQLRRQQEAAARQQRLVEEQKATGRDEHVPLDQWQVVDVGGEPVRLKIHDNDVTSFDVWISGGWRRQVPKAHGITHSRTDEVPIYSNGRATLYYVWEISGRLNHCMLRVRDA
jgi:hypothetical protein